MRFPLACSLSVIKLCQIEVGTVRLAERVFNVCAPKNCSQSDLLLMKLKSVKQIGYILFAAQTCILYVQFMCISVFMVKSATQPQTKQDTHIHKLKHFDIDRNDKPFADFFRADLNWFTSNEVKESVVTMGILLGRFEFTASAHDDLGRGLTRFLPNGPFMRARDDWTRPDRRSCSLAFLVTLVWLNCKKDGDQPQAARCFCAGQVRVGRRMGMSIRD